MKKTLYILTFLFLGANFMACTPDAVVDKSDTIESTWGENDPDPEDEEDPGN